MSVYLVHQVLFRTSLRLKFAHDIVGAAPLHCTDVVIGHVNELAPAPRLRSAGQRIAAQAKKTNFKGMTQCTVQILKFCTRSSHGSGG